MRVIKSTCLLARMKKSNMLEKTQPKLAICITMYNENENELKETMTGVLQNYNAMYKDPQLKMRQQDLVVVCVCDGYERIPQSFKDFAKQCKFFDEDLLKKKGFMIEERENQWRMKTMQELMDKKVKEDEIPKNILHLF